MAGGRPGHVDDNRRGLPYCSNGMFRVRIIRLRATISHPTIRTVAGSRPGGDLALASRDERVEGRDDGRVQRWGHRVGQELLPDGVGPLRCGSLAVRLPGLEVAPIRQQWAIERRLLSLGRVRG